MPEFLTLGGCVFVALLLVVAVLVLRSVRLLYEYERGVVFTLGRYSGTRDPGLTLIFPIAQSLVTVDMRLKTAEIPRQEVMTKDNIPLLINAVVYFRVVSPEDVIIKIEDHIFAVQQYTQAALRDVIGNEEMDTVLTEREAIADNIKKIVDAETSGWGVDVESIKIQEVELPAEMKRAMAKQAEAERERRAMIIASQGELTASEKLVEAAQRMAQYPGALHLRTLQTIRDIAADPSEKIVLFVPSDLAGSIGSLLAREDGG
jgi:regulator of protease activity HflC (stomatin/prohibitin superfamily)